MTEAPLPGLRTRTQAPSRIAGVTPPPQNPAEVEPYDSTGLYSRLVGENHIATTAMRAFADRGEIDMDFVSGLSFEKVDGDLRTLGVDANPDYRMELYRSINESDYFKKIQRIEERMSLQNELDKVGGMKAFGLEMLSYVSDPAAFVVDSVTGLGSKGRLLKRFLTAGASASLGEAAIQAALSADGETTKAGDVAMAMGTAFVLGGGIGAAFGKRVDVELETRNSIRESTRLIDKDDGPWSTGTSVGASEVAPRSTELEGRTKSILELRTDGEEVQELGKLKARFDGTASMWKAAKDNVAQKKLIQRLFPSFILKNKSAVDELSAVEWAEHFVGSQERELRSEVNSLFRGWLESNHGQGRWKQAVQGTFQGGTRLDLEEDFNEMVGKVMQMDIAAEERWLAEINMIKSEAKALGDEAADLPAFTPLRHEDMPEEVVQAAQSYFKRYRVMDDELTARGIRDRADAAPRQYYMPRKLSRVKAAEIKDRIKINAKGEAGFKQIQGLISIALKQGRKAAGNSYDKKLNDVVATAYAKRLLSAKDENGSYARDVDFLEEADKDFLIDMLEEGGIEADELMEALALLEKGLESTHVPEGSNLPARLKHRLDMDMDASIEITNIKGELETITMGDLFETNVDDLMFDYVRWAGGEVGLSKAGLDSHSLDRLIKEAGLEASTNDMSAATRSDPSQYTRNQVEDLEWMRDRVMGRSINKGFKSGYVRAARAATNVGFITRMGSAFWNALVESGTIIASNNGGRILRRLPAFKSIVENMQGKNPSLPVARQLSMYNGGLGDTMMRGVFSSRHEASAAVLRKPGLSTKLDGFVARQEDRLEGLKRGAAYTNLLGAVTDATRQFSSIMALDTLDDILVRGIDAPKWWANRAASWSLDDTKLKRIGDYLNSSSVSRGKLGEITDLGSVPLEVLDDLQGFLYRYTGEMIQHVNNGALPRWMQKSPIMRVLTQFRSFTATAWTKHTLKDIHFADRLAASKLVVTGGLASMAYMGRTYVDFYGTDEYDKRMKASKIIAGGFRYAVNASLMPDVIDQVAAFTPYDAPFAQTRTSGTASALISTEAVGVPIGKYAQDVGSVIGFGFDNVDSVARGKGLVGPTKSQLRAATNVGMIQTLWFLKPLETRAIEHFGRDNSKRDTYDIWETIGVND